MSVPVGRDQDRDSDDFLLPHQSRTVLLEFTDSNHGRITYAPRLLNVVPTP